MSFIKFTQYKWQKLKLNLNFKPRKRLSSLPHWVTVPVPRAHSHAIPPVVYATAQPLSLLCSPSIAGCDCGASDCGASDCCAADCRLPTAYCRPLGTHLLIFFLAYSRNFRVLYFKYKDFRVIFNGIFLCICCFGFNLMLETWGFFDDRFEIWWFLNGMLGSLLLNSMVDYGFVHFC